MPVRRPNRSFSDLPTDLSGHDALRAGDAGHEAVAERAEESLRSRQERALVGRLPEPRPRRLRDVHAAFGLRPLPGQPAGIDLVERIVADVAEEVRIAPREAAGILVDEPPRARLIPPRPVVGETAGLLKRPPRISKLHPRPARRRRRVQRPGRLPHHPSKTVVLPVLDHFPAVGGISRHDVTHGILVVAERPVRGGLRRGRRDRAAPREPVRHKAANWVGPGRERKSTPTPAVAAAPACGPLVCLTILPKLSYCRCSTSFPRSEAFPETMSRTESWWSVSVQEVLVVLVPAVVLDVPLHVSRSTARISSWPLP